MYYIILNKYCPFRNTPQWGFKYEVRKPAGKTPVGSAASANSRRVRVGVQLSFVRNSHVCGARCYSRWCQGWSLTALHWLSGERRSRLAVAVRAAGVSGTGARRWRCNGAHPAPPPTPAQPALQMVPAGVHSQKPPESVQHLYRYHYTILAISIEILIAELHWCVAPLQYYLHRIYKVKDLINNFIREISFCF